MAASNRKTKYWNINKGIMVERQRYIYVGRKRRENHSLWQLLHKINLGWLDKKPTIRKQYKF